MKILLIDSDGARRSAFATRLTAVGLTVIEADDFQKDLPALTIGQADAVLTEAHLPTAKGSDLVRAVHEVRPALPVVMITTHAYVDEAVGFCRAGAFDVLTRPLNDDRVAEVVAALESEADEQAQLDDPVRWDLLMREATHAVRARRFGYARRLLHVLVGQRPDGAAAFNLLGVITAHAGGRCSEQSYYRAALAFEPAYEVAQENLRRSADPHNGPPTLDPKFVSTEG